MDRNLLKQSFGSQNKQTGVFTCVFFKGNYAKVTVATVVIFSYSTIINQPYLKSYMLPPKSEIVTLVNWNEWQASFSLRLIYPCMKAMMFLITNQNLRPSSSSPSKPQALSPFRKNGFKLALSLSLFLKPFLFIG